MAEDPKANLNAKQIKKLEEFKAAVKDVVPEKYKNDEFYHKKWLMARQWDVAKAQAMLRKNIQWRKEWDVDKLAHNWTAPEVVRKYYPGGIFGYDKKGQPMFIALPSKLDMKGLTLSAKRTDIMKYCIQLLEKMIYDAECQSKKLGRRVDKLGIIFDLENYGMKEMLQPGMDLILKFFAFEEANYPEILEKAYVINAPRVFPLIWKIVKPFLSEDTQKKVVIHGSDYKPHLLEAIAADQLPVHFGGSVMDPDALCAAKICMGGKVPKDLYLKGANMVDESKTTKATVNKGSALNLDFDVNEPNQMLKWIFWTQKHDIKFAVTLTTLAGEKKELVAMNTVSSHEVPEDGFLACEEMGVYHFHFDNKSSWMSSKTVFYSIEVVNEQNIENAIDAEEEVHVENFDTYL